MHVPGIAWGGMRSPRSIEACRHARAAISIDAIVLLAGLLNVVNGKRGRILPANLKIAPS